MCGIRGSSKEELKGSIERYIDALTRRTWSASLLGGGPRFGVLIADKAYDSDTLRCELAERGGHGGDSAEDESQGGD